MSVVSALSERDRKLAEWFRRNGILHPYLTVAALRAAAIKPQSALALISMETGNGRNVFGHDAVDTFGCYTKGGNVTEARYRCYKAHRGSGSGAHDMQGVGPLQLTWWAIQDRADKAGGCWKPYPNLVTGFRVLKENVAAQGSLREGARAYNGSGVAAQRYADEFMRLRADWERKLHAAGFRV